MGNAALGSTSVAPSVSKNDSRSVHCSETADSGVRETWRVNMTNSVQGAELVSGWLPVYGPDTVAEIEALLRQREASTGLQVGWTTKTSLPRTVSYRETNTSPSEKAPTSASPSFVRGGPGADHGPPRRPDPGLL